ncbi:MULTISPECIES: hypothetical protein [Actinoalloteichus]|uniref:PE domain-containing protein n=1 Tax=Actinoalloteichus fjordicus TaxID=1612552 RepID=A0AAC9LFR5_9PSEU|nr:MULTISPECIES: hypothetical protein [Actinoalloteichus]APU17008.1 hypothetical protein UA74_24970 [Actinoalloteichus fjordicus]APU23088.1 hypothetical protein UA75_25550 [Actinoalloteichus sp. GBA129-24]
MNWSDLRRQIEARVDQAVHTARPPTTPPPAAGVSFEVDPDNVLRIAAALRQEADELKDMLRNVQEGLRMEPMGGDPTSYEGAAAITEVLVDGERSYWNLTMQHANHLDAAAQQCAEAARGYGYTEDEITAALRPTGDDL